MKILMLADTPADPNRGAAGTEVQTMLALRAAGHHVDAIWSESLHHRIRHGNLHLLLELPREYERVALAALRRERYDVLHVNQPHGFRAARAVRKIAPRTVFVHRSHGFELNVVDTLRPFQARFGTDARSAVRRLASALVEPRVLRYGALIAREADGHVVSSTLDARYLHDHLGVPDERIAVISHSAPDAYLQQQPAPMTAERLRHVLHVAQFAFFKAPMITAAAMNRIAGERPDARFTWVCNREDHAAVRALLSPAANARAELLHWMPQDELMSVYDRAGIFLFPSFYEGFGKAFLEAMSRGACAVVTPAGGAPDIITSGVDGVLVPAGDAAALAGAALALMGDETRARGMSEAAAIRARRYTWKGFVAQLTDFYQRLIEAKRA